MTSNYSNTEQDINIKSNGLDLSYERTYNSFAATVLNSLIKNKNKKLFICKPVVVTDSD